MQRHQKVLEETEKVISITCNKCGRVVDYDGYDFQVTLDFTEIDHYYSYGSTKHGNRCLSHVCEYCMDAFYATFAIPPQIWEAGVVFDEEPASEQTPDGSSQKTEP